MSFDMWLRMFETYLLAIHTEGDDWPDTRVRAMLLHCLGTEGQRIFYTLTNAGTKYDEAVTALLAHFSSEINVVVERHKFRQRVQRPHEIVTEYLGVLPELVATCEFAGNTDKMISDQLIEHASCSKVRERLLVQTDANLTLDKAVKLACQVEAAIGHVQTLTSEPQAPVHVVKAKPMCKRKFKPRTRSNNSAEPAAASKQDRCCFRCGSSAHLADAPDCPACKATCRNCNKTGHFAHVCKSKKNIV